MTNPDLRANLLTEAQGIFFERGYESSTMSDISTAAGVSKGALYHYFDSKQAVLEAVVIDMHLHWQQLVRPIVNNSSQTVIKKFNLVCSSISNWGLDNMEELWAIISAIHRPGNVHLQHQFNMQGVKYIVPEFAAIIEQGVSDGSFDISHIKAAISAAAAFVFAIIIEAEQSLILMVLDTDRPENAAEIVKAKFKMAHIAIERILGAPPNSLHVLDDTTIERWLA